MPSKASRAASKQAKLNRKKRRGKAPAPVTTANPNPSKAELGADVVVANSATTDIDKPKKTVGNNAPLRQGRDRMNAPDEMASPATYLHIELRQIGIITGLIVALLVALAFVLG